MGSVNNPIGGGPRDPNENRFRVEPVEDDHQKQNKKSSDQEIPKEKLGAAAFLLQLLKKAVDFFLESRSSSQSTSKDSQKNLLLLRNSLEILKHEDRSQDGSFLQQFSKIWHQVLEDSLRFNRDTAPAVQFKALIKSIQHFPENQQHTLGYYLTEYAGQNWIPFPYMELIAKIHTEHEKNPPSSILTLWTSQIDQLIDLLKNGQF